MTALIPRSAESFVRLAVFCVLAISLSALIGWLLDIPLLKSVAPQWISMRVITALCLALCAIALAVIQTSPSNRRMARLAQAMGSLAGLAGLLTLASYAGYASWPSRFLAPANRMAALTAIIFVLLGCAMVLLATGGRRAANFAHAVILPGAVASYIVPLSYLLGVESLHAWLKEPVALNTGIAFCVIHAAVFCARPDTWLVSVFMGDRAGGVMARRLLPGLLMLPPLIGWLRLYGERAGLFSSNAGVALVAATYTFCLLGLVWLTARSANSTEEELRESEERLRLAQVSAKVGIWDWNMAKGKLTFTPELDSIYGLAPGSIKIYEDWRKLAHPDDIDIVEAQRDEAVAEHRSFSLDFRVRHGSGELRWINAQGGAFYDKTGRAVRVLGVNIDVTERKAAEQRLLKLNRTLTALSDSNKALMRAAEETELLREVCRIVVEDCGYAMAWIGYAEADEGKTVRPVAHAGREEGYLEKLDVTWADTERGRGPTGTAIRTGKPCICGDTLAEPSFAPWRQEAAKRGYAASIVCPLASAGKTFGAISIYSKEPDSFTQNEVMLLMELAGDLAYGIAGLRMRAEHKLADVALRNTRDYLESLFKHANAPIICWDTEFKITRFNHAFERLASYGKEEVIGQDLSLLFAEDSREESLAKIRRTLAGEHWQAVEIPIRRKDGAVRIVLWNSANIYAEEGKTLLATIAQGQDITERKQAEEVLKRDRESLERLVQDRTAQILGIQQELEQAKRLSDIGTLAATVAHELRNPLAAISMAASNVRRKAKDAALDKHLDNIEKKIAESDHIISNLLFYSRLKPPHYAQANLHDIILECVADIEARSKKHVSFTASLDCLKDVVLEADPVQMREVFSNILDNAHDAVAELNGRIELAAGSDDRHVWVAVKDNGHGISAEDSGRIFEPFFTTKAKGTGLGLPVCRQIVTMHGGRIDMQSEPAQGTALTVTLPRRKGIADAKEADIAG